MCFFSVSEGSRRRGGCRPPKRAGRARTRPTASDSWSPRGRSPPQASCPSSRRRCPPAAPGRTAPRGSAGRTCGAHTARTTSATQTTSSPDSGRGAGCWTGKAVRAALSSQRTSGAWARPHGHRRASRGLQRGGAARQVPRFRPTCPKGPASRTSRDLRGPCRPAWRLRWTLGGRGRTRLGGAKPVAAHTPADTTPQAAPSGGGRFAAQDPRLSPRSSSCQPSACPPQLAAPGTGLLQAPAVPHLRNTWGAERAPGLPVWGGD